jgi:hypothetical protein
MAVRPWECERPYPGKRLVAGHGFVAVLACWRDVHEAMPPAKPQLPMPHVGTEPVRVAHDHEREDASEVEGLVDGQHTCGKRFVRQTVQRPQCTGCNGARSL